MGAFGKRFDFCLTDWLCKADFYDCAGYRPSAIYGFDGDHHVGRGFYLCGCGTGAVQWFDNDCSHCIGGRAASPHHSGDCPWMELFSAVAGNH